MSAMCRKCLKSAKEEARRCASCGGQIVRFDAAGEVIEADIEVDEKNASGSIPPLFADVDYIELEPAVPAPSQPSPVVQPPTSAFNLPPSPPNPTSAIPPSPANPTPANPTLANPPGPNPQTQLPTPLLLPSSHIDDVVSEMLTPFGFERPAPAAAPAPIPAPAPPANVIPAVAQNLQNESNEEQQVRFFRSPSSPEPASAPVVQAPAAASPAVAAPAVVGEPSESSVSMAELARDIFAISEDDASPGSGGSADGSARTERGREASSDLIIGPAQKGGWLKRGKASGAKGRTPTTEDPQGPEGSQGSDDPMSELTATETNTRNRLRSR